MLKTEEKARKTMCFRSAVFGGSHQLADGPGPFCIGSKCMAWVQVDYDAESDGNGNWIPLGYCGLVRQP